MWRQHANASEHTQRSHQPSTVFKTALVLPPEPSSSCAVTFLHLLCAPHLRLQPSLFIPRDRPQTPAKKRSTMAEAIWGFGPAVSGAELFGVFIPAGVIMSSVGVAFLALMSVTVVGGQLVRQVPLRISTSSPPPAASAHLLTTIEHDIGLVRARWTRAFGHAAGCHRPA